jgi:hypothetical protein
MCVYTLYTLTLARITRQHRHPFCGDYRVKSTPPLEGFEFRLRGISRSCGTARYTTTTTTTTVCEELASVLDVVVVVVVTVFQPSPPPSRDHPSLPCPESQPPIPPSREPFPWEHASARAPATGRRARHAGAGTVLNR